MNDAAACLITVVQYNRRKRHQAPGLRTVPSLAREPAQIIRAIILTQSQRHPHRNPSASTVVHPTTADSLPEGNLTQRVSLCARWY